MRMLRFARWLVPQLPRTCSRTSKAESTEQCRRHVTRNPCASTTFQSTAQSTHQDRALCKQWKVLAAGMYTGYLQGKLSRGLTWPKTTARPAITLNRKKSATPGCVTMPVALPTAVPATPDADSCSGVAVARLLPFAAGMYDSLAAMMAVSFCSCRCTNQQAVDVVCQQKHKQCVQQVLLPTVCMRHGARGS
jgi:hypothetical protein